MRVKRFRAADNAVDAWERNFLVPNCEAFSERLAKPPAVMRRLRALS